MHNEMQWPSIMRVSLKLNWDSRLDLFTRTSELTVTISETCQISYELLVIAQCYILRGAKSGTCTVELSQPSKFTDILEIQGVKMSLKIRKECPPLAGGILN